MRRVAVAQTVSGARGWIWLDGEDLVFVPVAPGRSGGSTRVFMERARVGAVPGAVLRLADAWCRRHRLSIVEVDPEFRDGRQTEL